MIFWVSDVSQSSLPDLSLRSVFCITLSKTQLSPSLLSARAHSPTASHHFLEKCNKHLLHNDVLYVYSPDHLQ